MAYNNRGLSGAETYAERELTLCPESQAAADAGDWRQNDQNSGDCRHSGGYKNGS